MNMQKQTSGDPDCSTSVSGQDSSDESCTEGDEEGLNHMLSTTESERCEETPEDGKLPTMDVLHVIVPRVDEGASGDSSGFCSGNLPSTICQLESTTKDSESELAAEAPVPVQVYSAAHLQTSSDRAVVPKMFPCSHCDAYFMSREKLLAHCDTHTPVTHHCAMCRVLKRCYRQHVAGHVNKPAFRTTVSKGVIDNHHGILGMGKIVVSSRQGRPVVRRSQPKFYVCSDCGGAFWSKRQLDRHASVHKRIVLGRKVTCRHCGKSFKKRSMLMKHVRKHERELQESYDAWPTKRGKKRGGSGNKQCAEVQCVWCFEMVPEKKVNGHLSEHLKGLPLVCPACRVTLSTKANYDDHVATCLQSEGPCGQMALVMDGVEEMILPATIPTKVFNCNICHQSFAERTELQSHQKEHIDSVEYTCNACNMQFKDSHELANHMNTHGDRRYECPVCNRVFAHGTTLKVHLRLHTGEKPFKCTYCDRHCRTRSQLNTHMRVHTGEKPYHCPTCAASFASISSLKVHQRVHTGDKPYKCTECGKRFTNSGSWKIHMNVHKGIKPFMCQVCAKTFARKSNLNAHLQSRHRESGSLVLPPDPAQTALNIGIQENHRDPVQYTGRIGPRYKMPTTSTSDVKPEGKLQSSPVIVQSKEADSSDKSSSDFLCAYCEGKFVTKKGLNDHLRNCHGQKPFTCQQCGYACTYQFQLTQHNIQVHGYNCNKPYQCQECGASFSHGTTLKVHIRTHTGEKPFQCSHCGKRCTTRSQLNSHTRTHTGEKPYFCEFCMARFATTSSLGTHRKIHTGVKPYKCTQCESAFISQGALTTHMIKHTREKNHKCTECGRAFGRKKNLKEHMTTMHTGICNFRCQVCEALFKTERQLLRHRNVHKKTANSDLQGSSKSPRDPAQPMNMQPCLAPSYMQSYGDAGLVPSTSGQ